MAIKILKIAYHAAVVGLLVWNILQVQALHAMTYQGFGIVMQILMGAR